MSAIHYRLSINNSARAPRYTFSYANTRKISLAVSRYGASVSFYSSKYYPEHLANHYLHSLIKESIKRIALIYLLQNQKPLVIKKIGLTIERRGREPEVVDLTGSLVFYQMFEEPLLRPLSDTWKDPAVLQKVLNYRKSKDDLARNVSALYAYLFSKTKKKEMERFSYLWIAMNGFFASIIESTNERASMNYFVKKYNLGSAVLSSKYRKKVCSEAVFELLKVPEPVTKEKLDENAQNPFTVFVAQKLGEYDRKDFDVTPYGFLLTDLPYYLRCSLFHAMRPLELFSFESDWELRTLRIVNGLLEEFLDQNLHDIFL